MDWCRMTLEERLLAQCDKTDSCWLWRGKKNSKGYGRLRRTGGSEVFAHRAAYASWRGPIPDGLLVLHSCDVRACINPDHLHLGTTQDNSREAVERGRIARGERHGTRTHPESFRLRVYTPGSRGIKLSLDDVRMIRAWRRLGFKLKDIAPAFGVHLGTISRIDRRETWGNV